MFLAAKMLAHVFGFPFLAAKKLVHENYSFNILAAKMLAQVLSIFLGCKKIGA
jgi:hypothetical protein